MAQKQARRGSSKDGPGDSDDDLPLPGETMQDDEDLRLEVNIDREMWNRWLVFAVGFKVEGSRV